MGLTLVSLRRQVDIVNKTVLYTEGEAKPAKLFVLDKTGHIREIQLEGRMTIGRETENTQVDICLKSAIVSREHGEFVAHHGEYFFRDLGSVNGTYINGELHGKEKGNHSFIHKLEDGDVLRIDTTHDHLFHPEAVTIIFSTNYSENMEWFDYVFKKDCSEINIGRGAQEQQGLNFDDEMVSRRHASIFKARLGWAIVDHDSTNGVFVNGERIQKPVYLKNHDVIRIINMYFIYLEDKMIYQNLRITEESLSLTGDEEEQHLVETEKGTSSEGEQLFINITERSVWQRVKKLTLLKDINIVVNSGEMVMILGGSGAGKTTFMNAVMGYEKAEGEVFHGETDIYNDFETMKFEIGYVPQQDLVRGGDCVYETLLNAAQMKLPRETTVEEQKQRVDEVLELLGLSREKDTLARKLSGGQRKRLSIAIEFIANPSLFFLDEPDSGLDGIMARSLNESLREIADTGKIVMVITHSPDRISELYDKVIVLAKSMEDNSGYLAYYGSVSDTLKFFETDSLEGVVKRINRPDEGGDGKSDYYIQKYREYQEKNLK